jgi:CBS domain-containing protein
MFGCNFRTTSHAAQPLALDVLFCTAFLPNSFLEFVGGIVVSLNAGTQFALCSEQEEIMPTESKERELQVKDIMTQNPVCCTPETDLEEVARLMLEHDCGEIPVVDSEKTMIPVGVITDRDIACRTVALGKNPLKMTAGECMSSPSVIITPETSLEECCKTMEASLIRRIPVVDESGGCCGIVSQADIARNASREGTAEVVKQISQPTLSASNVM